MSYSSTSIDSRALSSRRIEHSPSIKCRTILVPKKPSSSLHRSSPGFPLTNIGVCTEKIRHVNSTRVECASSSWSVQTIATASPPTIMRASFLRRDVRNASALLGHRTSCRSTSSFTSVLRVLPLGKTGSMSSSGASKKPPANTSATVEFGYDINFSDSQDEEPSNGASYPTSTGNAPPNSNPRAAMTTPHVAGRPSFPSHSMISCDATFISTTTGSAPSIPVGVGVGVVPNVVNASRSTSTEYSSSPSAAVAAHEGGPRRRPRVISGLGIFGADVFIRDVCYQPPDSERRLLDNVSLHLPKNNLGLLVGRSGSGKTTLLQLLAGLLQETAGGVVLTNDNSKNAAAAVTGAGSYESGRVSGVEDTEAASSQQNGTRALTARSQSNPRQQASTASAVVRFASAEERMSKVGLVFQFPERHFLGRDVLDELTFAWPKGAVPLSFSSTSSTLGSSSSVSVSSSSQPPFLRQVMAKRVKQVLKAVGLERVPLNVSPSALSGGQQRRLALALQLVRAPRLLLLDEPLAGLDWRSRAEVVDLLRRLREHCTLLVVSHDLAEIAPLAAPGCFWRMHPGGRVGPFESAAAYGASSAVAYGAA